MRRSLFRVWIFSVVLSALGVCLFVTLEPTDAQQAKPVLSVEVASPEFCGKRTLSMDGGFPVVVTNVTEKPVRVWSKGCSWGYGQLMFELVDDAGKVSILKRKPRQWRRNRPLAHTLAPGEPLVLQVRLTDGSWDSSIPLETLKGRTFKVWTIFQAEAMRGGSRVRIKGDPEVPHSRPPASKIVWAGRVTSREARKYVLE